VEHVTIGFEDIPVMLGDMVAGVLVVYRSKLKWTMDERILMCQVDPFTKWKEFVSNGVIL
jgi:hypothetical protein